MNYTVYKLNDKFNNDQFYNYYAVKAISYMSLSSEYASPQYKLFGGIKYMWLNSSLCFSIGVDAFDENIYLFDYSPKTQFINKTYTLSSGINFSFTTEKVGVGHEEAFSESFTTNGKGIINNTKTIDDNFEVNYIYDGFNVNGILASQYLLENAMGDGLVFSKLLSLTDCSVEHNSNYSTFLQEMSDGILVIFRRPKTEVGSFAINIICYGTQLYIDYDWKNSHHFDYMLAQTGQMILF